MYDTNFFIVLRLGKIQATARKDLVNKTKEKVKEGEVYDIENLLVTVRPKISLYSFSKEL
jgi:hypothetical protein